MKLFVQIPCFNEEATLPLVVKSIPRAIPGVDEVRLLVIDDGSTDQTVAVARALGVDYVVSHHRNRGLAAAFQTGLDACLRLGADIIVNTDGDNQYPQQDLAQLIEPILSGRADMVVGDRQLGKYEAYPAGRRVLQRLGSWTVRRLSGARVADAPSGFRAFTRAAAEQMNVMSSYTYTLETLIQAGRQQMLVENVPIRTNPPTRRSRLMRSTSEYVVRSLTTMLRAYAMYEPFNTFFLLGLVVVLVGAAFGAHWAYFRYVEGLQDAKLQSMVLSAALIIIGLQVWALGILASLIGVNRRLLEQLLVRVKRIERGDGESAEVGSGTEVEEASEIVRAVPDTPASAGRR